MRRSKGTAAVEHNDDDDDHHDTSSYFTYRPLSNLPTPPPTSRQPRSNGNHHDNDDHGEILSPVYRGPAIHLVNLIPASASLRPASVPLVQSILTRANLALETVALAVCVLDRLDAKFGRKWRLVCPLRTTITTTTQPSPTPTPSTAPEITTMAQKRHSLPPAASSSSSPLPHHHHHPPQLHIDAVRPEIIVLAALVVADKFADDAELSAPAYCAAWGRGLWSPAQLNATERAIVEGLDYRIVPLAADDCLADAMLDMQLAASSAWDHHPAEPTPPLSDDGADPSPTRGVPDRDGPHATRDAGAATAAAAAFAAGHTRSKTMLPTTNIRSTSASVGLGLTWATAV